MASDDKLREWSAPRGESGEGVIAGHVRMNHFDFMLLYKASQIPSAGRVERIAQWEYFDIRDRYLHMCEQWRLPACCKIKIMAAGNERIREVSQVALTAAKG